MLSEKRKGSAGLGRDDFLLRPTTPSEDRSGTKWKWKNLIKKIEEGREKHAALMVLITSKYKGFPPSVPASLRIVLVSTISCDISRLPQMTQYIQTFFDSGQVKQRENVFLKHDPAV